MARVEQVCAVIAGYAAVKETIYAPYTVQYLKIDSDFRAHVRIATTTVRKQVWRKVCTDSASYYTPTTPGGHGSDAGTSCIGDTDYKHPGLYYHVMS